MFPEFEFQKTKEEEPTTTKNTDRILWIKNGIRFTRLLCTVFVCLEKPFKLLNLCARLCVCYCLPSSTPYIYYHFSFLPLYFCLMCPRCVPIGNDVVVTKVFGLFFSFFFWFRCAVLKSGWACAYIRVHQPTYAYSQKVTLSVCLYLCRMSVHRVAMC